jgi:integrase
VQPLIVPQHSSPIASRSAAAVRTPRRTIIQAIHRCSIRTGNEMAVRVDEVALAPGRHVQPARIRAVLQKAEIRQIRIHDLRHTFASLLLQQGESVGDLDRRVSELVLHVDVMDKYAGASDSVRKSLLTRRA